MIREAKNCKSCELHRERINVVIHRGNKFAKWCFIAEAPGEEEDEKGRVLVGPSGKLFDKYLQDARIPKNDWVASNTIHCVGPKTQVKLGDGNLTWTVNKEYEYLLDRGNLDTVREGDQQPMDVSIDSVYEHITTGTSETITPYDALNGIGGASEWVSSSSDACEPYAVDVEIEHSVSCGTTQDETTLLPDFRYETFESDLDAASLSMTGRCNASRLCHGRI